MYLYTQMFLSQQCYCNQTGVAEVHNYHEGELCVTPSPVGPSPEYPRLTFPPVASATGLLPLTDWSNLQMPK